MSGDALIQVEGVSKKFCRSLKRSLWYGVQDVTNELLGREGGNAVLRKNEFWVLDNASFELRRGECLGLIGPNGAGKSTLLKMLNGLVKPDKGTITTRGRVAALIELGAGFNPILTARENIYVNGSVLGLAKREIDQKFDAIVDFAELDEFVDTPVQNYSSGMKVRLGFAIAAQMNPDILLIDEVLAVGDTGFRAKCYKVIGELSAKAAVILVSHSMPIISRTCSRGLVLNHGKPIFSGLTARAIDTYYDILPPPTSSVLLNNGEIEIAGIEIRPGNSMETNSEAKFVATLLGKKCWEEIEVNFVLLNRELTPVCQFSSRTAFTAFGLEEGMTTVAVQIPSLQLNPGVYGLSVTVEDVSKRQKLCWEHNAVELVITGNFHGNAPYQGVGQWTVN